MPISINLTLGPPDQRWRRKKTYEFLLPCTLFKSHLIPWTGTKLFSWLLVGTITFPIPGNSIPTHRYDLVPGSWQSPWANSLFLKMLFHLKSVTSACQTPVVLPGLCCFIPSWSQLFFSAFPPMRVRKRWSQHSPRVWSAPHFSSPGSKCFNKKTCECFP